MTSTRRPVGALGQGYVETSRTHRDPLEAANEILRTIEDRVQTSHHDEIGEIEAFSDDGEIDLGGQDNYPSNFNWSVIIPGHNPDRMYQINGSINRAKGGWTAGAYYDRAEI
jgi:hypothetical protein